VGGLGKKTGDDFAKRKEVEKGKISDRVFRYLNPHSNRGIMLRKRKNLEMGSQWEEKERRKEPSQRYRSVVCLQVIIGVGGEVESNKGIRSQMRTKREATCWEGGSLENLRCLPTIISLNTKEGRGGGEK